MTDMRRGESMYDLDPASHEKVERGIDEDGSNLSGVTSRCWWEEWQVPAPGGDADDDHNMAERHEISPTGGKFSFTNIMYILNVKFLMLVHVVESFSARGIFCYFLIN